MRIELLTWWLKDKFQVKMTFLFYSSFLLCSCFYFNIYKSRYLGIVLPYSWVILLFFVLPSVRLSLGPIYVTGAEPATSRAVWCVGPIATQFRGQVLRHRISPVQRQLRRQLSPVFGVLHALAWVKNTLMFRSCLLVTLS